MPLIVKNIQSAERRKNASSAKSFDEMRDSLRPKVIVEKEDTGNQVIVNGKVIEKPSRYMLDMLLDDQ